MQFEKQGASSDDVNAMFREGAKEATAYGVPVNQILKDLGQAPNVLARFGIANAKQFAKAAAKARSYGLTLKDINSAFGKQLDTFEGSAEASAKLNTVFGTTINSLELMMETDPTKRMEMLRRELTNQGKSWEDLTKFEQNVVTSTLSVDEAQAQLILSSEKTRKSLESQAAATRAREKTDRHWNAGMQSIKKTLIAWDAQLDRTMRGISELFTSITRYR